MRGTLVLRGYMKIFIAWGSNSLAIRCFWGKSSHVMHWKKDGHEKFVNLNHFLLIWRILMKQKTWNANLNEKIWSNSNNLPSFLIPIFKHFLSLQCWHWFLWCWSTLQFLFPRHWYVKLRLTERLKKLLQPKYTKS